ncbi:adenosylcobinamide-GDP ribazoletransferase [Desulfurispirillum indicum]|uniref:adenosylcobinamide-GDP ribazoletransferase n=1 Tax=Desulfurispirillum indicum TaxID=936456 RepID=UPI001CF9F52F|nr:adenosylcobinamide-GDP ribazoletransferase [Desulfurispirillum indicum]UCZ56139.1 adenosylcobinamide-GDP ribazoletransferase [Desulfurispirillum indicum]
MKGFLSALGFLTIIRIPGSSFDGSASVRSFGWVGLLIGSGLALVHWLAPASIAPLLMVLYLVVITGALHLDGLADSADALFSHRDHQRKLEIMRDVHVGTMGVVAVVLVLGGKLYAFMHLENLWILVAVPVLARLSMVVAMHLLPYARGEGLASSFYGKRTPWLLVQFLALSVLLGAGYQITLALLAVFVVFVALVLWWYRRMIGGVTGDMLGALCETCELVLFVAAVVILSGQGTPL